MRIAFISADWGKPPRPDGLSDEEWEKVPPLPGGAGWYRCAIPARALAAAGHDVMHVGNLGVQGGRILPVDWQGKAHEGYEVIILQRWMHADGARVVTQAREAGQVVINDLDDWMWGLDSANRAFAGSHVRPAQLAQGVGRQGARAQARAQLAAARGKGDLDRGRYRAMRRGAPTLESEREGGHIDHYNRTLAASSGIIASTPYLADRLRERNRRVPIHTVRNAIDLARWRWRAPKPTPETVGWVGAAPYRSGDLETLRGRLGYFAERHHLSVIHSGAIVPGRFAEMAGVAPSLVEERAMATIVDYPRLFDGIDIGLVPLRDAPFNYAKSCIKSMEYSAAGVPFRAAYSPENRWFAPWASGHKPGRFPNLDPLMDASVRQEEAERNRARVEELDIAKRWEDWERTILEICAA